MKKCHVIAVFVILLFISVALNYTYHANRYDKKANSNLKSTEEKTSEDEDAVILSSTEAAPAPVSTSVSSVSSPEPVSLEEIETDAVSELNIRTAQQWNDFARSFNDGSVKYADYLTVNITGSLNFSDMSFVPIYSSFNGIIRGSQKDSEFSEFIPDYDIEMFKRYPGMNKRCSGFCQITSIEEVSGENVPAYWEIVPAPDSYEKDYTQEFNMSRSLFGISCDNLTIENLSFNKIDTDNLLSLFAQSANTLSLKNVAIQDCHLSRGHALLAINSNDASIKGLFVSGVKLDSDIFMSGLLYWVYNDASFKEIYIYNSTFSLTPDAGSSGFILASFSLLTGNVINGAASFDNIDIYQSSACGLGVYVLCEAAGDIESCRDISVERCSFLCYSPRSGMFTAPPGLLFSDSQELTVPETNVTFQDCLLDPGHDAVLYAERGYILDNCTIIDNYIDKYE